MSLIYYFLYINYEVYLIFKYLKSEKFIILEKYKKLMY